MWNARECIHSLNRLFQLSRIIHYQWSFGVNVNVNVNVNGNVNGNVNVYGNMNIYSYISTLRGSQHNYIILKDCTKLLQIGNDFGLFDWFA